MGVACHTCIKYIHTQSDRCCTTYMYSSQEGVAVESDVQKELECVIETERSEMESLPNSDFKKIFWDQQVLLVSEIIKYSGYVYLLSMLVVILLVCEHFTMFCFVLQVAALKAKGPTGVCWHPLFVRWCLNLSRVSPKAYEIMRESGMSLPTRRTLNDYTHWVSAKPGFSCEVDEFLRMEAKVDELEDWQRYVHVV